jgi:hypothetical protein
MKAQIHITGQISGNFTLLRKLNNGTKVDGMFNSFHLYFESVGEAKKAMRQAWKSIKSEDDSLTWHDGLSKDCERLNYDASTAILSKQYNNQTIT